MWTWALRVVSAPGGGDWSTTSPARAVAWTQIITPAMLLAVVPFLGCPTGWAGAGPSPPGAFPPPSGVGVGAGRLRDRDARPVGDRGRDVEHPDGLEEIDPAVVAGSCGGRWGISRRVAEPGVACIARVVILGATSHDPGPGERV